MWAAFEQRYTVGLVENGYDKLSQLGTRPAVALRNNQCNGLSYFAINRDPLAGWASNASDAKPPRFTMTESFCEKGYARVNKVFVRAMHARQTGGCGRWDRCSEEQSGPSLFPFYLRWFQPLTTPFPFFYTLSSLSIDPSCRKSRPLLHLRQCSHPTRPRTGNHKLSPLLPE